ncbi:ABC transporter substrate-binding protein [Vulcanimicrobium alpinum]|uniref:ABC transporter substrate-binding protein n=1 Tax=Vulcanimicrobium alpinum TaxID=3016050 RepID=A0AAN2CAE3_UNVUL|nr:extracellular solute-binding protein [Vulcanimicrobium alpinum]BDE07575.1 ABC transporter substrate-binding protein [Vulcanimicrobium alpinum]
MHDLDRRRFLALSAAGIGAAATAGLPAVASAADASPFKPEKGATLQLLRWTGFVKNDDIIWAENTKKFTAATGVPVQIQSLSWPDVTPKAALAAQVGSGPDIIMGWNDDPFVYPDKLVDMTDLAEYMGKNHGGYYDAARSYCYDPDVKRWVSFPIGVTGNSLVYRKSWAKDAGFAEFPKDLDGMLKLARGLKKAGHPCGFSLGHAVGDANSWTHWVLWSFGGKQANPDNSIAINSPETANALEYAKALYETMIEGVSGWLDPSNNQAFLAGQCGLTMNGISIWYVAKDQFPAIYPDIAHAVPSYGPSKQRTTLNNFSSAFIFKYSKYPQAAKEYLRFMLDSAQAGEWVTGMRGYVTPALKQYGDLPVWTSDPQITPYRDVLLSAKFDGFNGRPGKPAAQALDEFVVVDMFADACVNKMAVKDAMRKAETRLSAIYKRA